MVVRISIVDDSFVETTETLDGILFLTSTDPDITFDRAEASISIIDDDGMSSFSTVYLKTFFKKDLPYNHCTCQSLLKYSLFTTLQTSVLFK